MNKQNVVSHIDGILLSLEKGKSLDTASATTWVNLEDLELSKIASCKMTNIVLFLLLELLRVVKFIETEREGEGMGSLWLMGLGSQLGKVK